MYTLNKILIGVVVLLLWGNIAHAIPVKWNDPTGNPNSLISLPITNVGATIGFNTELGAFNRDSEYNDIGKVAGVVGILASAISIPGGPLWIGLLGAGASTVGLGASYLAQDNGGTKNGKLTILAQSTDPNTFITGIGLSLMGTFVTEVDDFIIDFGHGNASVDGTAQFGAKNVPLTWNPVSKSKTGDTEIPTGTNWSANGGLSNLWLSTALLQVNLNLTAINTGSSDTFSAATWDTFQSQLSYTTVPEPSTLLLLGSGLVGLVGYRRKRLLLKKVERLGSTILINNKGQVAFLAEKLSGGESIYGICTGPNPLRLERKGSAKET